MKYIGSLIENGVLGKVIPYRYGRAHGTGRLFNDKGRMIQEVTVVYDSVLTINNFDSTGHK